MLVLSSVPVKAAMAQYSVMTNDSDVILHKVVLLEDEVDELAELSKENIEKVQQRGHRLEALQEKSEYLLAKVWLHLRTKTHRVCLYADTFTNMILVHEHLNDSG